MVIKQLIVPLYNKKVLFRYFFIATLILLSAILLSCSEDDYIDYEYSDGKLVMYSFLTADSLLSVHLSRSVEYSSNDFFERVYDGYITIEQNNVYIDTFTYIPRNNWMVRNNIKIVAGSTFTIMAGDSKGRSVRGVATVPIAVPVNGIDTTRVNTSEGEFIDCRIWFTDPPAQQNYYQLVVTEEIWQKTGEGTINYSNNAVNYMKTDSVFFIRDMEGSLLGSIDFKGSFSDFRIDGTTHPLKIRIPSWYVAASAGRQKKRITFMLLSQTADYYNFIRSRIIAEYNYTLPVIDPVKIHTNIAGGLGLVGAISAASDSLVFTGSEF